MSGIEFVGFADACLGLTSFIYKTVRAAKSANGLPKEIENLFQQLPLVISVFEQARERPPNKSTAIEVKSVFEQCGRNLKEIAAMFEKSCPKRDSPQPQRVWKAAWAQMSGRMDDLQSLWRQVEGNLRLLEQKQIIDMGKTLDALVEQQSGRGKAISDVSMQPQSTDAR